MFQEYINRSNGTARRLTPSVEQALAYTAPTTR